MSRQFEKYEHVVGFEGVGGDSMYTRIPPTREMDEMVVNIMTELLSTLALATKERP